jgi:hypothetical protein
MEFRWIRSRCRLGKGVGYLERGWTVSGMEFWEREPGRREQVRESTFGESAVALSSDFQVQRRVHERHPRSCGQPDFILNSTFSNSSQFWAPGNFELVVLAHPHERSE